jgi:hypothetical protein
MKRGTQQARAEVTIASRSYSLAGTANSIISDRVATRFPQISSRDPAINLNANSGTNYFAAYLNSGSILSVSFVPPRSTILLSTRFKLS